jgi:thioredoxin reductase
MRASRFDVVIVGGGAAGLSAALMLGRCRRRVAVCDDGQPRNAVSKAAHGLFTRDGENPRELLRIGRAQLLSYGVELIAARVIDVRTEHERFIVSLASNAEVVARRLLLATGLVDHLPPIEGIEALYGTSVFHCPYCDGFEVRDQPLAVYARGADAVTFAVGVKTWSADVVLCTDGDRAVPQDDARQLERYGIPVRTQRIARLEGSRGLLEHIVFEDGSRLARSTMFFDTDVSPRSDLATRLGCTLTDKGTVNTDASGMTAIPGLYVAGDAAEDLNFLSIAAAHGTKAAFAIHKDLRDEDLG